MNYPRFPQRNNPFDTPPDGPTKRTGPPPGPCRHHQHDAPHFGVSELGEYEHRCPSCGKVSRFTIGWDSTRIDHP